MSLTTVLLAGGLSRRMGVDKANLVIRGERLWARQLALLRLLQPQALWISARERPSWCPSNVECVEDQPPSHGPMSGIVASLNCLRTSHLLVLAVDLPRMTESQLRKLSALAAEGRGVIPVNGDIFEPLCAIYPVEAVAAANAALAGKDFSLQQLAHTLVNEGRLITYSIRPPEKIFFHNANTPVDLSQL